MTTAHEDNSSAVATMTTLMAYTNNSIIYWQCMNNGGILNWRQTRRRRKKYSKKRENETTWRSDNENIASTNGNVDNVLYTIHRFAMLCIATSHKTSDKCTNIWAQVETNIIIITVIIIYRKYERDARVHTNVLEKNRQTTQDRNKFITGTSCQRSHLKIYTSHGWFPWTRTPFVRRIERRVWVKKVLDVFWLNKWIYARETWSKPSVQIHAT